jgi:hypothetical protein
MPTRAMAMKRQKQKVARMDVRNRALCYALRNPPTGHAVTTFDEIIDKKLVRKMDGTVPSVSAIKEASNGFHKATAPVGRKKGWRKTTKADDKRLLTTFHKVRPPGHGVTARRVHSALPVKIKKKICKRTVIRRLAEKGFTPRMKLHKQDFSVSQRRKRVLFGKAHLEWTAAKWKSECQGCADFKLFTWYPMDMRPTFDRLKAPWTYMTDAERNQIEFQRPKRWFPKKEWAKVRKQKVFGLTLSTGDQLCFLVPKPYSTVLWAADIKNKVVPFLKRIFPSRTNFTILFDGEYLLHGPEAKVAMQIGGITVFPKWPGYSPDLNPEENVWAWSEPDLRKNEKPRDSFEVFQQRLLKTCKAYPDGHKLIAGMPKRMRLVVDKEGANIGK